MNECGVRIKDDDDDDDDDMMGERWGRTEMFTEYYHPKTVDGKMKLKTYLQIEYII